MSDLKAATDAIRADARLWDEQVDAATRAAGAIRGLNLFTIDLPLAAPVKHAVNSIVPLLHDLAAGAGPEFKQIADDLRLNAQAYEDHEAEVTAHVKNAY